MPTSYTPALAEKLATPFCSKKTPFPLTTPNYEGGRIIATNSFIALNLPAPEGCALETVPNYPAVDVIVQSTKARPLTASIVLNADYLETIAEALRKYAKATSTRPHIRLDIHDQNGPAILTLDGTDAFALIMPIRS